MVILKTPMNGRGGILEPGTLISLPPEVEKAMIEAGNAERVQATPKPGEAEAESGDNGDEAPGAPAKARQEKGTKEKQV